jgi:hypothetical protein
MNDSFDRLRQRVLDELQKQQGQPATPVDRAEFFGAFVSACLTNLGYSRAYFANVLEIEPELADAILDGVLPESEIDEGFIVEIARIIRYEPVLLRVILGRGTMPNERHDTV